MDRLKLETAYRRALDVLMSAVDERQLQAAIFRLHRAQARLHGWRMPGSHDPERRGYLVHRHIQKIQGPLSLGHAHHRNRRGSHVTPWRAESANRSLFGAGAGANG
jgi:hypothetical protein